jgi:hypothetical protein
MKRPESSRCERCVGVDYQQMCKTCKGVNAQRRRTRKKATSSGSGAAWKAFSNDALTRQEIMVARGYEQELIDMNRERINEGRDNK